MLVFLGLHWSLLFASGAMGKFVSVKVVSPEAVANDYGCMPAQFSGVRFFQHFADAVAVPPRQPDLGFRSRRNRR